MKSIYLILKNFEDISAHPLERPGSSWRRSWNVPIDTLTARDRIFSQLKSQGEFISCLIIRNFCLYIFFRSSHC
jgi:hypothetical protein